MVGSTESPELETESVLTGLSRGRFGRILPERIARHVVAATPGAEWPVRRGALDALARRHGFAMRDGLRVAERPADAVFGAYRTRGSSRDARPYETHLLSLAPLRTSCSCKDFVRSSLGLCKHGLVVLETLEKAKKLAQALPCEREAPRKPELGWDCLQPLRGTTPRL